MRFGHLYQAAISPPHKIVAIQYATLHRIRNRTKGNIMMGALTATEIEVAGQLALAGLKYWQTFQAQAAAGTLTKADLDNASDMLNADVDALVAARDAQKAQDAAAQQPTA